MKKLFTSILTMILLSMAVAFAACGGSGGNAPKNGTYTENGLVFEVKDRDVHVIGAEEGATEATVPAKFRGLEVDGIAENALEESSLKKLTFADDLSVYFSIGAYAFNLSSIEEIAGFPADISMIDYNALAGLKNLKSITVSGEGEFSVENGALIQTDEGGAKILRLLPAASEPQANYDKETKTYTVSGFSQVFNHAASYNQFIENVVVGADVSRVQEDAFSHIKLASVTMEGDEDEYNGVSDVMIEGGAFTAHKDLKIYVPATDDSQMRTWLSNSKNYIYGHNLLVHPVACSRTDAHIHGVRNTLASGSYAGYDITLNDSNRTIDIEAQYSIMGHSAPDLFQEYEG